MTTPQDTLLSDRVYRQIRGRMLDGSLQPGDALSVPRLATDLNVSRSPVREAVQRLISEGLAVHVAYAGAKVRQLDDAAVRDVFVLRATLDALAARLSTPLIGEETLAELAKLLDEQRRYLNDATAPERDADIDRRFHALIRDASSNEHLIGALIRLEPMAHLVSSRMWHRPDNRKFALEEHEAIAHALARGDANAAAAHAEAHVHALQVRHSR